MVKWEVTLTSLSSDLHIRVYAHEHVCVHTQINKCNLKRLNNHMQEQELRHLHWFHSTQGLDYFFPFLEEIIKLRTCFPFPGFDVDNYSSILLSEVLQDDHIMGLIGVIHINTAGSHTEDLEHWCRKRHLVRHKLSPFCMLFYKHTWIGAFSSPSPKDCVQSWHKISLGACHSFTAPHPSQMRHTKWARSTWVPEWSSL